MKKKTPAKMDIHTFNDIREVIRRAVAAARDVEVDDWAYPADDVIDEAMAEIKTLIGTGGNHAHKPRSA